MTLPFCNFSIKRDLINLYFKGQDNVADYVPFTSKPKTVRTIISNVSDGKMYFANVIICRSDLWGFLHQTCRDVRLAFHTRLLRLIQYFALNHHLHIYHSHCVTCLFLQSDFKAVDQQCELVSADPHTGPSEYIICVACPQVPWHFSSGVHNIWWNLKTGIADVSHMVSLLHQSEIF